MIHLHSTNNFVNFIVEWYLYVGTIQDDRMNRLELLIY